LQNEAQVAKATPSDIVARQTETMRNQVDHHLRRARAASRGQEIGVSTEVTETLQALARTLAKIYSSKNIDFDIDLMEGLVFRGAKRDLEEMAGNLMDNGCKWTATSLQISSFVDPQDETSFIIAVSDDGPGMASDQYTEALKRGARLDEATPGSGFGLAIVDDLARAYKGSVALSESDLGGLDVKLTLVS